MIPSAEIASLRFLQFEANSSHIWFTSCHVGEFTGCQSLPLFFLPCACHFRSFAILGDCNILLNLGMGGKYHNTFVGILLVFLVPTLFTFHLDIPQVGHEDASFNSFLYNMQSFGFACIFFYSIPNAFNVSLASYMDKGILLFTGSISLIFRVNLKSFYLTNHTMPSHCTI